MMIILCNLFNRKDDFVTHFSSSNICNLFHEDISGFKNTKAIAREECILSRKIMTTM